MSIDQKHAAQPERRIQLSRRPRYIAPALAMMSLFAMAAQSTAQQVNRNVEETSAAAPATRPSESAPVADASPEFPEVRLTLLADEPSVAVPTGLSGEDEGFNSGGVSFDLKFNYMTDFVYRGVDYSDVATHKKSLDLQFDGRVTLDLGKFPHPFAGVFVNVDDSDPISRFQEIRPYFGLEWKVRPLTIAGGQTSYIFPERESLNTAEVWGKVTLDDSYLLATDQPILSPYFLGAYDYDLNKGWYFEAGVRHDIVIEDTGLTISFIGDVAYIVGMQQQFVFFNRHDTGFQHYDAGMELNYSLNKLFSFPKRYGEWSFNGYLFYTGRLERELTSSPQLWGGLGIELKY